MSEHLITTEQYLVPLKDRTALELALAAYDWDTWNKVTCTEGTEGFVVVVQSDRRDDSEPLRDTLDAYAVSYFYRS